jgi:hypothetical protein
VLTVCRSHNTASLRIRGAAAGGAKVAYPPAYFDVVREPGGAGHQHFSIRLRDRGLPDAGLYIYVRASQQQRRVAVHEFSCPTPGGSCAFAT